MENIFYNLLMFLFIFVLVSWLVMGWKLSCFTWQCYVFLNKIRLFLKMLFIWELFSCVKAEPCPLVKRLLYFNSSTKILFHYYRKTCLYCITRFCPPFWNRCMYFLCWICVSASGCGHIKHIKIENKNKPAWYLVWQGIVFIKYWTKRPIFFFLKNDYIIKANFNTFFCN